MKRIYLDYAATTPVHSEVIRAMLPYFNEKFGNASTIYYYGRKAKSAIEDSREIFANAIGADISEVVFTSGGTESDNFAIKGVAYANKNKGNHIITSAIDHHAVLETCHFLEKQDFNITYLPVNKDGLLDPSDVKKAITSKTILITIMHSNNEIGVIEPISEVGKIAKEHGIIFHTDAVQSFGQVPLNVNELNIDLLSVSSHKIYGPKGVGAIFIRKGTKMVSFIHGGEQERNRRAGTENVSGIVGFGKAVEIAMRDIHKESERLTKLRDKLIKGIMEKISGVKLNGHPIKRLPNNVNLSIQYVEGESMILNLDMEGICASTGSACTSGSLEPSHVIMALGVSHEIAHSSLRLTLGKYITEEDIDKVLKILLEIVSRLRALSPLYKE